MSADRYLKAILTIIALELGWIAITHSALPVSAQTAATRVVIVGAEAPLRVDIPVPLDVRTVAPVRIEPGERPIRVDAVPFTPTVRPGQ